MTNKWNSFTEKWLEELSENWDNNRFSSETLEQINEWQNKVKTTLEIDFTEKEIEHIVELNLLLDKVELKKNSIIDVFALIWDYKELHEWFTYENELVSKLAASNLNIVLKKTGIDITKINFDMVREYKLKNSKK